MKFFFYSFLLVSILPAVLSLSSGDYGKTFHGDGTYYGGTTNGNCAIRAPIPGMYAGMIGVAINTPQYAGSAACGACIEIRGNGRGAGANPIIGPIRAYIMDRCPECGYGAVDLGVPGDGRWQVSWKFVDCPGEKIWFFFEGSNNFYWKFQVRGMRRPVRSVSVQGVPGSRTQDNFFIVGTSFRLPATVTVTSIDGTTVTSKLTYFKSDGPVYAAGGASPVRAPRKRKYHRRCSASWDRCGSTGCCKNRGFVCKRSWDRKIWYKRCEPRNPDRSCVPKYKPCSGRYNWWGTSRCCHGFRCKRTYVKGFVGRRCEP